MAATRTFRLEVKVVSTMFITGMSATPLPFTVNLICTIDSITMTNPTTSYCHQALLVPFIKTPLISPILTASPSDCPSTFNLSLVRTISGTDTAFDTTLIGLIGGTGPGYEIKTQSSSKFGTTTYSWVASLTPRTYLSYSGGNVRSDFSVSVTGCFSTSMNPSLVSPGAYTYPIDGNFRTFTLPSFLFTTPTCSNPYSTSIVRTDTNTTIAFTSGSQQFSFS
jgi:hypothetical protein